jgi:hypothetical protein
MNRKEKHRNKGRAHSNPHLHDMIEGEVGDAWERNWMREWARLNVNKLLCVSNRNMPINSDVVERNPRDSNIICITSLNTEHTVNISIKS